MDNFDLKISSSPHVRSKDTTADIMFDVIIALMPATAFGLYQFGVHAAILVAACIISCVGFEALTQILLDRKVTVLDFSAAVTGLLLALNLPPELPVWMAVLGSGFAIIVVKQLFGGLGQNFMNPALAARCFLLLSFSKQMTVFTLDGETTATPLTVLKAQGTVDIKDMFLGFTGGTIGETSAAALLIGAAYLLIRRVISPRIPLVYIGSFAAAISIYGAAKGYDVPEFLLAHLCGGGLMLGAWFMATDYVTSPITPVGKIVYGICLGLLTFVLRIFGQGAEGVSYAIIISNLLVPLIERVTVPKVFGAGADVKKDKSVSKDENKADTDNAADKKPVEKASAASGKKENTAPSKMDKKSIALAVLSIFVITVVMGAALGVVYNVTKKPIEDAALKAKQEAYKEVFPGASEIVTLSDEDIGGYDKVNALLHSDGFEADRIDEISIAADGEKGVLGYIVVVTDSNGYGGDIQMVVGITSDLQLTGLTFLSINETVGLGMQATNEEFRQQFEGPLKNMFEYTKNGATKPGEIDALSGATITTSAVVSGVNAAVDMVVRLVYGGAAN